MQLTWADWLVIALYFGDKPGRWTFLLSARQVLRSATFSYRGREVPWWLAGTSMVATTFGADTPLVVTAIVLSIRYIRKLAVVVDGAERDDDGLPLRSIVAQGGRAHRYGVRRVALCRVTRCVPSGVPRALSGSAGQHHHHGLGESRDGQGARTHTGNQETRCGDVLPRQ